MAASRVLQCNCTTCDTAICETEGGCLKSVKNTQRGIKVNYKCVDWIPKDRPLQCYHDKRTENIYKVKCCRDKDFCAQDLTIELEIDDRTTTVTSIMNQTNETNFLTVGLVIVFTLISLTLLVILIYLYIKVKKEEESRKKRKKEKEEEEESRLLRSQNLEKLERPGSSGRLDNEQSRDIGRIHIANEIKKESIIGRGKFGTVHKCSWRSQNVAVKVFQSFHHDAWRREEEIYMTPLFRHDYILHFIASDMSTNDVGGIEHWLVTQFYQKGSLYEFLNANTITKNQLLSLSKCIAGGLEYIHDELCGTSSKPGIAHRDLKSSNILVGDDGYNCCIGDFGTAARFYSSTGVLDIPNGQVFGTKRYLSPEILNGSINVNNFDSLRQADIYALGLIFWELYWRTESADNSNTYQLPYFDSVPQDPSLEDMYTCVCVNKIRPKFISSRNECKLLSNFQEIMKECWSGNPSARLTARRIAKKLCDNN